MHFRCGYDCGGAKIGKNVYWTPTLEIGDRSLIEIGGGGGGGGDRVLFGQSCGIFPHVVKPKKQDLMLYVKKVKIGSDVFIGAGSKLTPGVTVKDQTFVPANSCLYPNTIISDELQKVSLN